MADLLKLSSVRLPESVDLPAIQRRGLYTHFAPINEDRIARGLPVQSSGMHNLPIEVATLSEAAASLHSRMVATLEGPVAAPASSGKGKDKQGDKGADVTLSQLAAKFLAAQGVRSLKDLHPLSHLAISQCGSAKSLRRSGLETTIRSAKDPDEYFTNQAAKDLGRISNTLLCGVILHEPADKLSNLMNWWRSLLAASVGYVVHLLPEPTPEKGALIDAVFHANLYLPSWVYKLRGCTDPKDKKDKDWAEILAELEDGLHAYEDRVKKYDRLMVTKMDSDPKDSESCCDCQCEDRCLPVNPRCICVTPFVTNYYLLKDKLHCYVPAELAYIEVVAAGEEKERVHQSKTLVETTLESESNVVQKEERDLQVTDRSTLHTEIERQMQMTLDVKSQVNGTYPNGTYEVHADAKLSRSSAEKATRELFREAVSKAAYSMQKTTRTLSKERRQTKTTETNKHGFKNETDHPFITKYFYVNQQRKAQVYDYGMRLIVELIIPSPAALFEALWNKRVLSTFHGVEPIAPLKLPDPSQITYQNYLTYAKAYGVTGLDEPPAESIVITLNSEHKEKLDKDSLWTDSISLQAYDGYEATSMVLNGDRDYRVFNPAYVEFWLANSSLYYWKDNQAEKTNTNIEPPVSMSGGGQLEVRAMNMTSWTARVEITLTVTAARKAEWQSSVYSALKDAYEKLLAAYQKDKAEYDRALAEHREAWDTRLKARHPFYNRETAQMEIKRSSIFMMCQSFDEADYDLPGPAPKPHKPPTDPVNWHAEPCGLPELDRPNAKRFGQEAYFWDRAFDWDLMSYILFDYFWNPMCKWMETFDVDHPDAMFRAFLQAGYARVHVPVSEGMEEDVEWYLLTGQKWGQQGKPPLDPSDSRWRSIAEELKLQRGCRQDDRPGIVNLDLELSDPNDPQSPMVMRDPKKIIIQATNFYLDASGAVDDDVVEYDINREIYIDMVQYRIVALEQSPDLSTPNPNDLLKDSWVVTLDRPYEGDLKVTPFHTVGARFVGAPFLFEVPTDLVWASAHDSCLPCYPVTCVKEP